MRGLRPLPPIRFLRTRSGRFGEAGTCGTMGGPGVGPAARERVAQDRQPERREPSGHGSTNRGRWRLLPAGVAVVLLALVAVGSLRGPLGTGRGRPSYPADLIDSLLLLLVLAILAGAVLGVIALWPGKNLGRARRGPAGSWNVILPMAAILLVWLFRDLFGLGGGEDRKSTRLNSSHTVISYAVFCLKKKKTKNTKTLQHKKKKTQTTQQY